MGYAHGKHHHHQRPAATQTIESVAEAKIPRRSDPTSIMLGQKVERVTTDSKALFFLLTGFKEKLYLDAGDRDCQSFSVFREGNSPRG
jgi:hypothetical protein